MYFNIKNIQHFMLLQLNNRININIEYNNIINNSHYNILVVAYNYFAYNILKPSDHPYLEV